MKHAVHDKWHKKPAYNGKKMSPMMTATIVFLVILIVAIMWLMIYM